MLRRDFRLRASTEDRARLLGGFAGGSSGPLRQVGMLASLGRSLLSALLRQPQRIAQTGLPIHRNATSVQPARLSPAVGVPIKCLALNPPEAVAITQRLWRPGPIRCPVKHLLRSLPRT